ncbi:hypothetical protein DYB25_008173 [Aphanomyces astaci]|uniref:Uncharacterized protein n=1 Tax=Aphanomyces astaci TaxID=112090 RepID=A0A397BLE2_APHAT|nr:hypothetical protein DYB36_005063 [Aphanomyces astaci]RHY22000.1 hypothetical protein DYB25_008173 [Aphanomyces astaci]RHY67392.1 hypothetical protein DYB34_004767 [Aphanomyces astaci]RHZ39125.1 hypothetical protein DYB31_011430 [Aphanomyces astaci]
MELTIVQDERRLEAEHEKVLQQQTSRPVTTRVRDALRRFTQRNIVGKLREETTTVFNQEEYASEKEKYLKLFEHLKGQEASLKQLGLCVSRECNARIKMDHSDTRFRDVMRQMQGKTTTYGPTMEQHVLPQLRQHVQSMEALMHDAQHALVVVTRVLLGEFKRVQSIKGSLTEETLLLTCTSMGQLMNQMTSIASAGTST